MLHDQRIINVANLALQEIRAIADHEHLTPSQAEEMHGYLLETTYGQRRMAHMLQDRIDEAVTAGRKEEVARLTQLRRQFLEEYPEAAPDPA